jgi:hypothetical protein
LVVIVVVVLQLVVMLTIIVAVVIMTMAMAITSPWAGTGAPAQLAIAIVDAPETSTVLQLAWDSGGVLWGRSDETGVFVCRRVRVRVVRMRGLTDA